RMVSRRSDRTAYRLSGSRHPAHRRLAKIGRWCRAEPPSRRERTRGASSQNALRYEHLHSHHDPPILQTFHELRSDACWFHRSQEATVLVHAGLEIEQKDVLEDDDVAFHPYDLGDVSQPPSSVLQPGLMDDHIYGRSDLLTDRADRE